jgi:hypothetical protein
MQERTMKQVSRLLKLATSGALVAAAFVAADMPASAQTSTAATAKKPPTSATPEMIKEAIQRTQARAAKLRDSGTPERFGSEEPFTFDPSKP